MKIQMLQLQVSLVSSLHDLLATSLNRLHKNSSHKIKKAKSHVGNRSVSKAHSSSLQLKAYLIYMNKPLQFWRGLEEVFLQCFHQSNSLPPENEWLMLAMLLTWIAVCNAPVILNSSAYPSPVVTPEESPHPRPFHAPSPDLSFPLALWTINDLLCSAMSARNGLMGNYHFLLGAASGVGMHSVPVSQAREPFPRLKAPGIILLLRQGFLPWES